MVKYQSQSTCQELLRYCHLLSCDT